MKLLYLCFILALGFNEFPAETEAEREDEVSKAEERARAGACLSLARNYVMKTDLSELFEKHPEQAVKRKVAGDITYSCYNHADQQTLEAYLLLVKQEADYPPLQSHLDFDRSQFSNEKAYIGFNLSQVELYEKIWGIAREPYVPEEEQPYVVRPKNSCEGEEIVS